MSLILNGTSQYAMRSASDWTQDEGTLAFWFQPDFAHDSFGAQAWFDVDTALHRFILVGAFGAIRINVDGRERDDTLDSGWTPNVTWVPLVHRWKKASDQFDLKMGGIAIGTGSASGTWGSNSPGTNYYIGFLDSESDVFFAGKVAHVARWDSALSDGDRDAFIAGDNPLVIADASLIHYRPLTEDGSGGYGSTDYTLVDSPSFDAGDNPEVDDPPASGSSNNIQRRFGYGIMLGRGQF